MQETYAREIVEPASEEHWLQMRDQDVTSTMSSALFGLSPYLTEFELYHAKASGLTLPFDENDRVRAGRRLQDYAADTIAEKHGWKVFRRDEYHRIPALRTGTSLDYEVLCPKRGKGNLEIKGVDYFQYQEKWTDDEAPDHIEVQVQHQMEVAGKYEWTCIAAFTSIYDWHEIYRDRDREFGAAIVKRIGEFWAAVDAGEEPKPDYSRDLDAIKALHKGGPTLDATDDIRLNGLLARYNRLKDEKKLATDDFDAVQAELLDAVGDHSEVFGKDYKLKLTRVKDSLGTLVTEDMVGKYVGGRAGYLKPTLSDLHKKGRAA